MKCEAIFANSSSHSVRKMCKVLGLREAVRCRRKKAEERRNRRIREEREDILAVKEDFEENHRIYGCRRMRQALSNAIARFGRPKALVFHSDRGCQYSSKRYLGFSTA